MLEDTSEAETRWLRDLRAGRTDALEELVARHGDALLDFILYRVGHRRGQAEDLVQDTFLTAMGSLASFDGRSSLRTWLFGIAKNKAREALRARSARPLSEIVVDADDEILRTLGRIEAEPIPDEVLERAETREFVGATLSSLPDAYREALTERYITGRSVRETAERQGRGVKAAESTLHRARQAFRDVFKILTERASMPRDAAQGEADAR